MRTVNVEQPRTAQVPTLSWPRNLNQDRAGRRLGYHRQVRMSLVTLGVAEELAERTIAMNGLLRRPTIATAAPPTSSAVLMKSHSRSPKIRADAAYGILT